MRIAFIIVCMAAIATGLVQLRGEENRVRNETLTLRNYCDIEVPRQVWAQEVEISRLASYQQVGQRTEALALQMIEREKKDALARTPEAPEPTRRDPVPARPRVPVRRSGR